MDDLEPFHHSNEFQVSNIYIYTFFITALKNISVVFFMYTIRQSLAQCSISEFLYVVVPPSPKTLNHTTSSQSLVTEDGVDGNNPTATM